MPYYCQKPWDRTKKKVCYVKKRFNCVYKQKIAKNYKKKVLKKCNEQKSRTVYVMMYRQLFVSYIHVNIPLPWGGGVSPLSPEEGGEGVQRQI